MTNELSYTGKLFRRIVVSSGFTYGKRMRVSVTHLTTKFADDYDDMLKKVYRRNSKGYWELNYEVAVDRRTAMQDALDWLEANGFITISRDETVRVSRLLTGLDSFVKLTEKGLAAAPKYLKQYDPDANGCMTYEKQYEN